MVSYTTPQLLDLAYCDVSYHFIEGLQMHIVHTRHAATGTSELRATRLHTTRNTPSAIGSISVLLIVTLSLKLARTFRSHFHVGGWYSCIHTDEGAACRRLPQQGSDLASELLGPMCSAWYEHIDSLVRSSCVRCSAMKIRKHDASPDVVHHTLSTSVKLSIPSLSPQST
jgi:hypothetical protein